VSTSTLALITVPILTGVIGYTTNWTGVLMLFYPVHFRGLRAPWLLRASRWLPYKVRQIPGLMIGGIGWQGIVPSRAAKMGSLAVDSGIAKLGTPREFFQQLDPVVAEEILTLSEFGKELLQGPQSDRTRALIESALLPAIDRATGPLRPAVRMAIGHRGYEEIRHAFATEPIDQLMGPLTDPEFSRTQSTMMRKLIAERMREMAPADFGNMLRTATREDEWLLLAHGAVVGLAGGLVHLAIFG
jgi:hypothetical protein